jgi:uncharacterized protein YutE (UPF0331/DUF86 family)|nr:DUF86 domain-containing protein [uncultured Methanoregula sp.]
MKKKIIRKDVIRIKITEIRECLDLVSDNLPDSYQDFSRLGLVKDGIYKRMEFAIEDVFDICAIINTDLTLGIPSADDDILAHLESRGIFDARLIAQVRRMRGFRNIVVHRYGTIDDRLAFSLLTGQLPDFFDFIDATEKFLTTFP